MKFNPDLAKRENERIRLEEKLAGQKAAQTPPPIFHKPWPGIICENPRGYIRVPMHLSQDLVIAIEETHKGKNMYSTLDDLKKEFLKMPSILEFMTYRKNVLEAATGKRSLFYADNTDVPRDITEDLWKRLSSGHRGGCWTWLNAYFFKKDNNWSLYADLEPRNNNNLVEIAGRPSPISFPDISELVGLDFDAFGLPKIKSLKEVYDPLENIFYRPPEHACPARFLAYEGGSMLSCQGWSPLNADPSSGVFACAEIGIFRNEGENK